MLAARIPLYTSKRDQEGLRVSGRFNAHVMDFVRPHVRAGVTTGALDRMVYEYTLDHGHTPACLGYKGYPKTICTSVNEVVCHGIPSENQVLHDGDIVNVDITTIVGGWYGDLSETFLIGNVSKEARHLTQVTFDSLFAGIHACEPEGRVFDIGRAIFEYARARGPDVVQMYQGHGIGRDFHQEPGIPHFPHPSTMKISLQPGMCFTIEPMLNLGSWETAPAESDGWTVRTKDGSLSAQFEHTILMTEEGPEILTLTQNGPQEGHRF